MIQIRLNAILLCLAFASGLRAQRNVLLIIADDLGTDYLGFYEDHRDTAPTPNIRRLLSKGLRFTNAWSNPVCSATRAGMLTGRYSFRTGVGGIVDGQGSSGTLNLNELTLPQLLKFYLPNQVATANVGKWHLHQPQPVSNLNNPNLLGYDLFSGVFIGQLASYYNWTKVTNGVSSNVTNYATTETVDDAVDWLQSINKRPFFLWLAFNAPHAPYHLPPAALHSYTGLSGTQQDIMAHPKNYFKASLEALDTEIGRLFSEMEAMQLLDSTDIIFIGDNGNTGQTAQNGNPDHAKGSIYEYGVHVPFLISGPSVQQPGRVSDALVQTTDLFATIVEMFGFYGWPAQIDPDKPVDSKSLMPLLANQSQSIRPWAFTEIFQMPTESSDGKAIRDRNYKLLRFDDGREEMYRLDVDPDETNNLLTLPLDATALQHYSYLCHEMENLLQGNLSACNPALATANPEKAESAYRADPNPFFTTLRLQAQPESGETFLLMNVMGKIVYSGDGKGLIDLSGLPPGTYWLKSGSSRPLPLLKM